MGLGMGLRMGLRRGFVRRDLCIGGGWVERNWGGYGKCITCSTLDVPLILMSSTF